MRPQESEKLILASGIVVLGISLAWPAYQKFSATHDVRAVAASVVDIPRKFVSSARPGKTLSGQVQTIVDGLSPDVAMADAELSAKDIEKASAKTPVKPKKKAGTENDEDELEVVVQWSSSGNAKLGVQKSRDVRKWSFPAQ